MPKTEIDYSNTIIYKITCKDKTITDVYVGHTTNFVQRKHAHKQNCLSEKAANHNCKLYEVIRANGGWTNWRMEIINFFNCADHYAARKKEQEYFIELKATLNSIEPLPKPKIINKNDIIPDDLPSKPIYFCNVCIVTCNNSKSFEIHKNTNKHQKNELLKAANKNTPKFYCEKCDFACCKQSDYERHILTAKHIKANNAIEYAIDCAATQHLCTICSHIFKHASSLSRHKRKCVLSQEVLPEPPKKHKLYEKDDIVDVLMKENLDFKNIILDLVKSNTDLQKQMLEVCKNGSTTINNNHSNNKTFNLHVFLNEQCKDAMNIMDFVNSMTLELSDVEDVGKLGYVEGISKIMIRKLNEMDVYKRPIHCSDAKREIMYVRDNNVWGKENSTYDKLRKAIKHVSHKNSCLLGQWSQAYPECMNNQHPLNDTYVQMIGQSMGGRGEFVDSENKIMKKIAKAVFIDKSC